MELLYDWGLSSCHLGKYQRSDLRFSVRASFMSWRQANNTFIVRLETKER